MKIPVIWLNDFVKVDDIKPADLAARLVGIGFEVEEILYTGDGIEGVVTGRIVSTEKHPDADKLTVCRLSLGDKEITVVTGASNIKAGDIVPVATDGATLPGGKTIRSAPLRGVMSCGMLCSGAELNVDNSVIEGAEVHGILILPPDTPVGEDIRKTLHLDQYVLDVSVTANRPDCQSVYGIAREVGAVLGRPVKDPDLSYRTVPGKVPVPQARVEAADLCAKYSGRIIEDVKIEPSPEWMRLRLRLAGIRPINNLVDITNYVLIEMGQPLHAFDDRFVKGGICVRKAAAGEEIVALDGNTYTLTPDMLVIADDEKPIAIAGVMGGEYSGIMPDTTSVFLEAATFARGSVRATSRALGLRSDSSARYERGVSLTSVAEGRERALHLCEQLGAGTISDKCTEAGNGTEIEKVIETSAKQISDLLGIRIAAKDIVRILTALRFTVTKTADRRLICKVPAFRTDVDNYTDLAEEVIRYYGYDKIRSTFLAAARPTVGGRDTEHENMEAIKDLLCGYGAFETLTYGFINKKQYDLLRVPEGDALRRTILLQNPLSEEFACMRTQLTGSLLKVVYTNVNRKNDNFRLFEIARTFWPKALPLTELPEERQTLCIALVGKDESFYALKEIVAHVLARFDVAYAIRYSDCCWLHPGVSADIVADGVKIGSFGKVHPKVLDNFGIGTDVYTAEIDLQSFIDRRPPVRTYKPLPRFPAVERDLALVVTDDVSVGSIIGEVKAAAGDMLESVRLFDVYKGAQIETGHKSVALSLVFRAPDRTLDEKEVQAAVENVLRRAEEALGAKLRLN